MSIPELDGHEAAHGNRTGGVTHQATSGILYVRAALKPFARQIKQSGDVAEFLGQYFGFEELFVPYFTGGRPFWRSRATRRETNSGALGKAVARRDGAVASRHPSHRFAGFGPRVTAVLRQHDETASCFYPISELAKAHDFSMLLLACVSASPGFSTVHAVQNELGLTQRHLERFLLRWDYERDGRARSKLASESPGCSASFGKFYPAYEQDDNLIRGTLFGAEYLLVSSARKAMAAERAILRKTPRFVECGSLTCLTCRFRLY